MLNISIFVAKFRTFGNLLSSYPQEISQILEDDFLDIAIGIPCSDCDDTMKKCLCFAIGMIILRKPEKFLEPHLVDSIFTCITMNSETNPDVAIEGLGPLVKFFSKLDSKHEIGQKIMKFFVEKGYLGELYPIIKKSDIKTAGFAFDAIFEFLDRIIGNDILQITLDSVNSYFQSSCLGIIDMKKVKIYYSLKFVN